MAYPVTLNGRTYTLADFEGTNYVEGLPDAFEDFVTHAGDIYNSTSTTSNTIGTGSKTFTVDSSKPYQAGTPLRIADASAPSTNFIDAIVTSYSGTTLVVDAVGYQGSGTLTSWNVNIGGAASVAGTLGIAQGGTGASTAADARTNLEVYSKADADSRFLNVSGEASDVSITGNTTIGDASSDTLTINATASFTTQAEVVTGTGTAASFVLRNDTDTSGVAFLDFRRGASSETFGADNFMDWRFMNASDGDFALLYGKNSTTSTVLNAALNGITNGVDFAWNNGTTVNSFGAYEFHQSADEVTDGLAIISTAGTSLRFYVDSNGVRSIAAGSTDFITFTNSGGFPDHIGLNENVAINPDGLTIDSDFPSAPLHVKSSDTTGMVIFESTDSSAASAPDLYFYNNSSTPAADDYIGNILFRSNDDAGNDQNMSQIFVQAKDVTTSGFATRMMLKTAKSGGLDTRLAINESGRVTIGVGEVDRTNLAGGAIGSNLSVEGTDAGSSGISIVRNSNDTNPAYLTLNKSRGTAEGSNVILQDGDDIGRIIFGANDGTNFMSSADIISRVQETTPGTNNVGATLELRTGGGQNVATTSRMKINSTGRFGFNQDTSDDGAYVFKCLGDGAGQGLSVFSNSEGASLRLHATDAGVRSIKAGSESVMTFKSGVSEAAKVQFPKGDGISVTGNSEITHTDFNVYNMGTTPPTWYVGYNSVSRTYNIDPSVELAIERASDSVLALITDSSSSSSVWFGDEHNNSRGQINYAHSSDSMVFKTNSATAFTISSGGNIDMASGNGINFNASESSNATSSKLDDYEEGTFEPVLTFGGSSVNAPAWYAGNYTKIGRRVFVDIRMSWSGSLGSNTGGVRITLPFTVANSTANTQWEAVGSFFTLSGVDTGVVPAFSDVENGLIFASSQGTTSQADHTDFTSGANFRVTGHYRTT